MGIPEAMDALRDKARFIKESLSKSQCITDSMVSILGSFDHRLSALETAMRPTQLKTHSIRRAHENIDKTLKAADVILAHFDLNRKAEAKILKGPHEDLESYLEAIDQLKDNIKFFSSKKGFRSNNGVINNANNMLAKALSKLEDEFRNLLSNYRYHRFLTDHDFENDRAPVEKVIVNIFGNNFFKIGEGTKISPITQILALGPT